MIIKVSQQDGATTFNEDDFKIVGPDGAVTTGSLANFLDISASNVIDVGGSLIGGGAAITITGGTLNTMKVGESITLVFSASSKAPAPPSATPS